MDGLTGFETSHCSTPYPTHDTTVICCDRNHARNVKETHKGRCKKETNFKNKEWMEGIEMWRKVIGWQTEE
jgi:hypothetical protein